MIEKLRIIWGARDIGAAINRTERQTHHLLEKGAIRAARKVGAQWCASLNGLQEQFCHDSRQDAIEDDNAAQPSNQAHSAKGGTDG